MRDRCVARSPEEKGERRKDAAKNTVEDADPAHGG